ncbi:MAG: spore coat associated protein CotJA [Clostridia bacterium]|nr:spore coat associated protein CotJA [Clostridia bacterium]MBR2417935.1 spore coat associated protein CotJA [Clostridia bacterium]
MLNNNTYCQSAEPRSCQWVRRDEAAVSAFPENMSLAMAYVPFQHFSEVYSCEKALKQGTIFPCLDKPFLMGCARC